MSTTNMKASPTEAPTLSTPTPKFTPAERVLRAAITLSNCTCAVTPQGIAVGLVMDVEEVKRLIAGLYLDGKWRADRWGVPDMEVLREVRAERQRAAVGFSVENR